MMFTSTKENLKMKYETIIEVTGVVRIRRGMKMENCLASLK